VILRFFLNKIIDKISVLTDNSIVFLLKEEIDYGLYYRSENYQKSFIKR